MSASPSPAVARADIEAAYARISGHIRETPVIAPGRGAFGLDLDLSLKLECLQHTGSFKPRGAFNSLLSADDATADVAAASGGNHGAAVAFAASQLGRRATIFVPEIASPVKVAKIRQAGADVRIGGARYADAADACAAFRAETGAIDIHPYDTPATIAGQGTVGLEWERAVPELDTVLVAVGGGGLMAGIATWYEQRGKIVAVEPDTSHCLKAARDAGHPVDVDVSGVAADSLGARRVGDLVFAQARAFLDDAVTVPDAAIRTAQARLWRELGIAAEPGGATALAALLAGAYRPEPGERVGVLVCGCNVDLTTLADIED
ncbi:threonine/serine dehydratase [Amorphus orientalis]|uniref:Threonine dehydratase n=1 Tax=Amorphus orientalis TaxID=649198 RepID=A0AAE3VL41_9HYPH|nr:threonine/serine dehydratase [Amorphus orientalis]MDQ0313987.1 threonine dehydratase [Amorphus orientalis]